MTIEPKIGTVVLNFRTYQDTLDCVASLKQQNYHNQAIVVVENGSGNESAKVFHKVFDDDPMVTLIVSERNLGFAKGNNLGIRHAHEKLNCEYVFVLNSDTIVPDGVFKEIVKVDCTEIGAISPSVVNINGLPQPPSENSNDILARIKYLRFGLYRAKFLSLPLIRNLYGLYLKLKPSKTQEDDYLKENNCHNNYGKYVLQGCSYFLTPTFFQYYTQLYPNTFLYWEEANLLLYLQKVGLHSVAINTPPITHKEAQATKALVPSNARERQKLRFSLDSYRNSEQMFGMTYQEIKQKFN